jgi:hypothetical protein
MGKQLEKLIVILGLILIGTAVFAEQTVPDIPNDNPVLVTREKKTEEVKQPEKDLQTKKDSPCCKNKKNNKATKNAKKSNKPQYLGLKIYETKKPQQKVQQPKKLKCADDPKSICNTRKLKPAKPYDIPKAPRYSRTYDDKYRKSRLPDLPPLKPAVPVPIITCY